MTIGDRIKKIREKNNYTQNDLANIIGKKQGVISAIEKNKSNITIDALIAICNEYKVSADWILFGDSTMNISIEDNEFIKRYNNLTEREKGRIDQLLDEIENKINTQR